MAGSEIKDQELVIMDGTDVGLVNWIKSMVWLAAPNGDELIVTHPIGRDHPDKIVIKFRSTDEAFLVIQDRIDEFHPGLCMYNPPMAME